MKTYTPSLGTAICLAGVLTTISACANSNGMPPAGEPGASAGQAQNQALTDMWIDTRLETAYLFNTHLNNFKIQTDVDDGAVLLTGTVRSDIDKDLAGEIARSLSDVQSVDNRLVVRESVEPAEREKDGFVSKVDDATTTAMVKTRLIANEHLSGLDIDVDTEDSVVTLSGEVSTDQERQLAGLVARNTPDVRAVTNDLNIVESDRS